MSGFKASDANITILYDFCEDCQCPWMLKREYMHYVNDGVCMMLQLECQEADSGIKIRVPNVYEGVMWDQHWWKGG